MKILLTLDYELFLGEKTGSVDKCLIEPMEGLLSKVDKYGIKFTIFVDATYLYKVHELSQTHPELKADFEKLCTHIKKLHHQGHDIQLHIHPHWFYSSYQNGVWTLDHTHYKLADLSEEEATEIFAKSKQFLDNLIGKETTAFRAGGFSTQPTERLARLFAQHHIQYDASVCPGMIYNSPQQKFNYQYTPDKSLYKFREDICKESNTQDAFVEIPISTDKISPLFYWKLALYRILRLKNHKNMGDGISVKTTHESIKERLLHPSINFATIDGIKIDYLKKIYKKHKQQQDSYFCILGHPKLATPYSIQHIESFFKESIHNGDQFITITQSHES